MSVSAFTSSDEKWIGEGREEDTTEERCEGERERTYIFNDFKIFLSPNSLLLCAELTNHIFSVLINK